MNKDVSSSLKFVRDIITNEQDQSFTSLSEGDKGELVDNIASLVLMDETDEFAKRFDNFMYGLILSCIGGKPSFKQAKKQLCEVAQALEKKISVPQVKESIPYLSSSNYLGSIVSYSLNCFHYLCSSLCIEQLDETNRLVKRGFLQLRNVLHITISLNMVNYCMEECNLLLI